MTSGRNLKIPTLSFQIANNGLKWGLLVFFLFFALLPGNASAFNAQEKLVFDLTWTGLKAGTATLEIEKDKDHMKIISTARSADWISVFYPVEDRVELVLGNGPATSLIGLPVNFRMTVREGSHRRDKETIFDHTNHQVTSIDHMRDRKKIFPIGENIHDPLSSFYYVRTLPFEVGKSVYVDIFDNNKVWNVEVQVLRKEKVKTNLGEFNTFVIKPLLKSEGIFNRKGDIYIWITDDQKRVPVKVQTKVPVGSITATLVGGNF